MWSPSCETFQRQFVWNTPTTVVGLIPMEKTSFFNFFFQIYLTFFCTKLTVEMCVVKVFFVFSIRKFHFIYSYVTRTFFYLSQITSIYKQYEKNTTAEHGTNVNITFKSKMSTFVSLGDLGIVPLLVSRPPKWMFHIRL